MFQGLAELDTQVSSLGMSSFTRAISPAVEKDKTLDVTTYLGAGGLFCGRATLALPPSAHASAALLSDLHLASSRHASEWSVHDVVQRLATGADSSLVGVDGTAALSLETLWHIEP